MDTEERWVDVEQVATHLHVTKETIYRWIDKKGFPAHKAGRLLRFKLSKVDDWVRDGGGAQDRKEKHNGEFFDEEVLKLDRWSEDLKQGLEREIEDIDNQIREARKTSALAQSLENKLTAQKSIKALEKTRNDKRRALFDAQDAIDLQREELIGNIEKQLKQRRSVQTLF